MIVNVSVEKVSFSVNQIRYVFHVTVIANLATIKQVFAQNVITL